MRISYFFEKYDRHKDKHSNAQHNANIWVQAKIPDHPKQPFALKFKVVFHFKIVSGTDFTLNDILFLKIQEFVRHFAATHVTPATAFRVNV